MRTAFIERLMVEARRNPRIFLVVGDLGYSVVEPYAREFPDRFLNAGVAEQNMTGVAAGLASEGFHVFTYSIANFPTLRCLEQIRNDICYHALPVTVVAVGGGFAYGNLGYSHHAIQDLAIMRALAELSIYSPADPGEARDCLDALFFDPRPSYLRLGKAGEAVLHDKHGFDRGPLQVLAAGPDCRWALVSTGSILKVALETAALLRADGLAPAVFSVPWLQPLPPGYFRPLGGFSRVVAVEEHLATGGLASLLGEHLPRSSELMVHAVPASTQHCVGSQEYLRGQAGLEARRLAAAIRGGPRARP